MEPSERLRFEPLGLADRHLSVKMSMDEAIMKYITGRALSEKEAKERFEYQLHINSQNADLGFIKAIHTESDKVIGYIKLVFENPVTMEIGYAVLPEFSGKGYASEMTKAMLSHVKKRFPLLEKCLGLVNPENTASIHILEKHGFQFEKEKISEKGKTHYYTKPS